MVEFKIILYVLNLLVIIITGAAPGCISARNQLLDMWFLVSGFRRKNFINN